MREILFRGKRADNSEWLYGKLLDLVINEQETLPAIRTFCQVPCLTDYMQPVLGSEDFVVDENTIGQYTGLKDKNGIEIYEGDIVEYSVGVMEDTGVVEWGNRHSGFLIKHSYIEYPTKSLKTKYYSIPTSNNVEVVGNIYENPELLEATNNV